MKTNFINTISPKIITAHNTDIDSKLGIYLQVNPELQTPIYENNTFEIERIHVTRLRTGSNNLLIETGRFATPRIHRESRICRYGVEIQTLRHVLMFCPIIIQNMEVPTFNTVYEFFIWRDLHEYLLYISKLLKIEI